MRLNHHTWGRIRIFGSVPRLLLALSLGSVLLAGCASTATTYPSYLPKKSLNPNVDETLVGTMSRPALQVEGLPVKVETNSFKGFITVAGPIVPGEGLPYQQAATTCTWTVTVKDLSGELPISVADFHSVDHLGAVFLLRQLPGETALPTTLSAGDSITFKLRTYELVGEGMMQWAPDHEHLVAEWDYTVEND